MKKLCIVTDGKAKIWRRNPNAGPTPASSAYIGSFAIACKRYAEYFYPDSYWILSAKYGFLNPDDIVYGDYDVSFTKPKTNPISVEQLIDQLGRKKQNDFDCIIALGGKKYVDVVKNVFFGRKIITPLDIHSGNGIMQRKMKEAIYQNIPLTDR